MTLLALGKISRLESQTKTASHKTLPTELQNYVNEMRVHMDTATNPYDASMEMIMPGVQERFNGLTSMVRSVDASIHHMESTVGSSISRMESSIRDLNSTVSLNTSALQAAARAVHAVTTSHTYELHGNRDTHATNPSLELIEGAHGTGNNPVNLRSPGPENNTDNTDRRHDIPRQHHSMQYRISQQFASLSLMWDEWHGIGGQDTLDKPVVGGFAQLEQTYKSKWRSQLVPAQQRHITRIRVIINGIKTMAQTLRMSTESALDLLETEWTRRKKSPDAMVRYLQENGFLKKAKARGRKKEEQPEHT